MTLRFNGAWRFVPPPDGQWINQAIPSEAVNEFRILITRLSTQGPRQEILEHFKGYFCDAVGTTHVWSSSEDWAAYDLSTYMNQAANNAPLFLEAVFDACQTLTRIDKDYYAPDATTINDICQKYGIGYEIRPPDLILRESHLPMVSVQEQPATLAEQAINILKASLQRADELLSEGRGREAVQETLWLLESVTTVFRGIETPTETIQGKYFNKIISELRRSYKGTTLDRVLNWISELHGYLSSPTGGGIRHGMDISEGVPVSLNEARLYCNLIRSYISFLLVEHEQISISKAHHDGT